MEDLWFVDPGEEQGDDVLTDSTPVVGAGTISVCQGAARTQRRRDAIRVVVRAVAVSAQLVALSYRFKDGAAAKIAGTSVKALGRGQGTDVHLRYGREILRHGFYLCRSRGPAQLLVCRWVHGALPTSIGPPVLPFRGPTVGAGEIVDPG